MFQLDWDITPWVERKMNRKLFLQNRERVQACTACLGESKGFCDWRTPLGTLWTQELDVCVEDNQEERHRCTRETGVLDDRSRAIHATFYSMSTSGSGLAACNGIDFPRTNREFRLNNMLKKFLKRT